MAEILQKIVPAPRLVGVELNPGPRRGEHMSDEERWAVINLWNIENLGTRKIAKKLNLQRKNVQHLIRKYNETGTVSNKPGQGRKRKLSPGDVTRIKKQVKSGKSAEEIAREEAKTHGGKMSSTTIRNALKESGLRYVSKEEREKLSEVHMQKRREFATRHMQDDWKNVLFSDEKSFWLGAEEKKGWQDPKHRTLIMKHQYAPKLQVWGGVGHFFKTELYFFEQNMDAELYRKILKNRLPPKCQEDCPDDLLGSWIFLQDNDPKHKAHKMMELLDEIAPDWMKDYPPKSPDFNIIEDVWSYLDRERKKKKCLSIDQLKRVLSRAWEKLPLEFVRKSVESMPRRLQKCLDLRGQRTNY